jgi:hypothetical protein
LLARSDCPLSRTTAARSTLLTYLFDAILNSPSGPFGFPLPSSFAFFTHPGYGSMLQPVAAFQAQNFQTSIQPSLPFRTLILPDRSAQSAAKSAKLTLMSGPLSLCSPPPPLVGCGSMLQNPSAFLAARSLLLETAFCSPAATALFQGPPQRGQRSRPISSMQF